MSKNNWYIVERGETERLTASISEELGEKLDREAESYGERSRIIAEALDMYLQRGDFARLENKLDLLLAALEVPHKGDSPEIRGENERTRPHGLSDEELSRVKGVIGQSRAQGGAASYEDGTGYEVQVSIPEALYEMVKDELDGQRGLGRDILNPALAMWFRYGGWFERVEEKLDIALGSENVPQPRRTAWAEQVLNESEQVDHEPYKETLDIRDRINQSGITPDQRVKLDPSQANPQEVKERSQYWAGFMCAIIRWEFENGDAQAYEYGELGKLVDEWFGVTSATRSKVVELVLEQMGREYHWNEFEAYLQEAEDARERSFYPELSEERTGVQKHPMLMWNRAAEVADGLAKQARSLGNEEAQREYVKMSGWFREREQQD